MLYTCYTGEPLSNKSIYFTENKFKKSYHLSY